MVSFDVSETESQVITRIVNRAMKAARAAGVRVDRLGLHMDLSACHCNGCPLLLLELLEAPDFDFNHDVFGISRTINRKTGKLGGFFLPRFARPVPQHN